MLLGTDCWERDFRERCFFCYPLVCYYYVSFERLRRFHSKHRVLCLPLYVCEREHSLGINSIGEMVDNCTMTDVSMVMMMMKLVW